MEHSRSSIINELKSFLQLIKNGRDRLRDLKEMRDMLQGHSTRHMPWILTGFGGSRNLAVVRSAVIADQNYSTVELQTFRNLCRKANQDLTLEIYQKEVNLVKSIIIAYVLNCLEYWRYRINPLTDDFNLLLPEPTIELRGTVFIEKLHHYAHEILKTEGVEIDEFRLQHADNILHLRMKTLPTRHQYAKAVEKLFADWSVNQEESFYISGFLKRLMILTNIICELVGKLEAPALQEKAAQFITTLAKVLGPSLNIEQIQSKGPLLRKRNIKSLREKESQMTSSQLEKLQQLVPCRSGMFKGVWH